MVKKILFYFFLFYFLILFQTSFLIHFWITFNLILILVIFLNLIEKPEKEDGVISAFFGGFFLDIFSEKVIGFHILILISLAIFLKLIFKKYVRIPTFKRV